MAELMEDGDLERHLNRMRVTYRARRDALCEALSARLGTTLDAAPPSGGLALWARLRRKVDVDAWASRCMQAGVAFRPGRVFAFDGQPVPGLRMGFAAHGEHELGDAVERMATTLTGA
jgi:GntR family transcriptional regulator/MocR family aminotransferase